MPYTVSDIENNLKALRQRRELLNQEDPYAPVKDEKKRVDAEIRHQENLLQRIAAEQRHQRQAQAKETAEMTKIRLASDTAARKENLRTFLYLLPPEIQENVTFTEKGAISSLPPEAGKYYEQAQVNPRGAALSVQRDLLEDQMKASWPQIRDQVAAAIRSRLGRELSEAEARELATGDMKTILRSHQLLGSDLFRKYASIPYDSTVGVTEPQMMAHGFRQMRDETGRTFWGKMDRDATTGQVTITKAQVAPEVPGGVLSSQQFLGKLPVTKLGERVPEGVTTGKEGRAVPVSGAPGVFEAAERRFAPTYVPVEGGVMTLNRPVGTVQDIRRQDLLTPENLTKANEYMRSVGASEITPDFLREHPEAAAGMVLDALNKAGIASGGPVYRLAAEDQAEVQKGMAEFNRNLLELARRGTPMPSSGVPERVMPQPQQGVASLGSRGVPEAPRNEGTYDLRSLGISGLTADYLRNPSDTSARMAADALMQAGRALTRQPEFSPPPSVPVGSSPGPSPASENAGRTAMPVMTPQERREEQEEIYNLKRLIPRAM